MKPLLFRYIVFVCLIFAACHNAIAQATFTLSGTLKDAATAEPLVGASVYSPRLKKGVTVDIDGRFSLSLPADTVTLVFSYVGYVPLRKVFRLKANQKVNLQLEPATQEEVVVVAAKTADEKVAANQMSMEELTAKEAKLIPVIFGEVDIFKILQLKPGVQSGGEGFSGLYVRGGGPDQNLVLIDDAPVYNPSHLFGFFSIFNNDVVRSVDLYKGGFPSNYGGRLSSVVDVKTRDGDNQKNVVSGGIGLISSRVTAEGPLLGDKATYLIGGRRTYFDIFTRQINRANENKINYNPIPDYYFYDLNGKITYRPTTKDKITLSYYYGNDVVTFKRRNFRVNFDWGNRAGSLRWVHQHSPRTSIETSLIYSRYAYRIRNSVSNFNFNLTSGIEDYGVKSIVYHNITENLKWHSGADFTQHKFTIGRASAGSSDGAFSLNTGQDIQAGEFSGFSGLDFTKGDWQVNGGLRTSGFLASNRNFFGLEPRLAATRKFGEKLSAKFNYTRTFQYLNLVTNSGASLPTDLWYPSNARTLPQIGNQYAGGWTASLFDGELYFSNEYYYRTMRRQIDIKDGSSFFLNDKLDTIFVFGKGWAYGSEFYLEKKKGKTTGWIGYTLSYTWRQFNNINFGEKFHPRYDRRHDVSVVVMHELNRRVTLSGAWVYGTGNAISLPEGRLFFQDLNGTIGFPPGYSVIPDIRKRNTFRMDAYHRLDLGLVYKFFPKWGESDLTFSIYNVYNRLNPFFIYFETITENQDGSGNILGFQAKQASLFPIIPSVTYNFKF
jgi:hypothetical protein